MNQELRDYEVVGEAAARQAVLVVDDSRAHRVLLTKNLEKWGYRAIGVSGGEEALEACAQEEIDLVISDWAMPGMSGIELCRKLRDRSDLRRAYFILLTAKTERDVLAEGLESGADDFLSKPVSTTELRARLRAGMRIVESQRILAEKNAEISGALGELREAYAAIDRDLIEARKFQESLVSEPALALTRSDVSLLFQPSGHVGGDMVGYFPAGDGAYGLYSVDVSGHGVSSALLTARIASYFNSADPGRNIALERCHDGYRMLPPGEVCGRLNALLNQDRESDLYLTMALAGLYSETGDISLCVAGHPSPVIQRGNGALELLETSGMPVGLVEVAEYETIEARLHTGDRMLIYSDGVTECPGPESQLLDEQGLLALMGTHSRTRGPDMLTALIKGLEHFAGCSEFPDDLSAVLVEQR